MLFINFKRSIQSIFAVTLVALYAPVQAKTGVFSELSVYQDNYKSPVQRSKEFAQKNLSLINTFSGLTPAQKQTITQYLQHVQTLSDAWIEGYKQWLPNLIQQSKKIIDIPLITLLQFCPNLFYYNLDLCQEAKQTYEAKKTYWDKELKNPKNKTAQLALIKQLKPKNFIWYNSVINKSGTLTEQILINFYFYQQTIFPNLDNNSDDDVIYSFSSTAETIETIIYSKPTLQIDKINEMIHIFLSEQILQTVIQKEKTLKAQGYETFFHARRWNWNFVNDICNLVTSIHNAEQYHANKHMLRFRPPNCDIETLYQYRKQLIEHGAHGVDSTFGHTGANSEATCMNRTILSNMRYFDQGECTGEYLFFNNSVAPYYAEENMLEQLIYEYDLQPYFTKYKQKIKNLITLHKKSNQYGELLCIAIKKEFVPELIYASEPFDQKCKKSLNFYLQKDLTAFSNQTYFDDEECRFYCLAVSDIPGEYNNKYFIESLCISDKNAYAQYCAARDALFAKIKAEYLNDHQQ